MMLAPGPRTMAAWVASALRGGGNSPWWGSHGSRSVGGGAGLSWPPQLSMRLSTRPPAGGRTSPNGAVGAASSTSPGGGFGGGGSGAEESFRATSEPLGRIFNRQRDYLFTAERNIRSFEWTSEEADELLDSVDEYREGMDGVQLNTICVVRRDLNDAEKYRLGKQSQLFDVYDGQQRLVSLSLLFAAIRERLLRDSSSSSSAHQVAEEAAEVIYPMRSGRGEPRVKLSERDGNALLKSILRLRKRDEAGLHAELKEVKKQAHLPAPAQCLLEVYGCYVARLKERPTGDVERLFYTLQEDVYLNVGIANSQKVAFNLIISQDKGKNIAYVDRFKALLCHHHTNDEATSVELQVRWNRLCEEVERGTVQDCCLLLAQILTRKKIPKGGEINLFDDLIKQSIPTHYASGKDFFEFLETAARVLRSFRRDARYEPKSAGGTSIATQRCSPEFLRIASTKIRASKEIELVVFALLLRSDVGSDGWHRMMLGAERVALWMMLTKPIARKRLQRCMDILDIVMERRGTSSFRHGPTSYGAGGRPSMIALDAAAEERREILVALDTYPFGSTGSNVLVAKAVLGRLNEHELVSTKESTVRPTEFDKLNIEHVLPKEYQKEEGWTLYWPDSAIADEWYPKLGNLALIGKKENVKMSNSSFSKKKPILSGSPYPLTQLVGRKEKWDLETLKQHHRELKELAARVFEL